MSEKNPGNEPFPLLSDDEFARLMMTEFAASSKKNHLVPHSVRRYQMVAWAAGLCFFLLYHPERFSLENEFFVGKSSVTPLGRSKSGTFTGSDSPDIAIKFVLENEPSTTDSPNDERLTALDITTTGSRYLRAEIHEQGRLSKIRAFDPLAEPLHEAQSALVNGKVWGYLLSQNSDVLICIKPVDAPLPPPRLDAAEMQKRATVFSNQCLFRARR